MKKNRNENLNELTELMKKVLQNSDSIMDSDKKRMKKLVSDPTLLAEAMQIINPDFNIPSFPVSEDSRSLEEIIADNYIALAKFAIGQMKLKNVSRLKVQESDGSFVIYGLTPEPVELDFYSFATSDYPYYKELLLEAEALQADLFMEDSTEKYRFEIIERIENTIL